MPLGVTPYIIAEAGTNHAELCEQARFSRVMELATAAKDAGADAVKFQLFRPDEDLFCPMEGDDKRWHRWRKTILSLESWGSINDYCKSLEIDLILSAFQFSGVKLINDLDITHKVASRAMRFYPYELAVGSLIVSTGTGPHLDLIGSRELYYLDCKMQYPVPLTDAAWGGRRKGLSDHSGTIWPAIDALARGAKIIEVHFRPEGFEPGPDAPVELTTDQLKLICEARDAFAKMRQS